MRSELRIVPDTGFVVSAAILPHSVPRTALDKARQTGRLLASVATMLELTSVLGRQKLEKYLPLADRKKFAIEILDVAEMVAINCNIAECRDPKDNMILELAVSGKADYIITGDADLLVLNPFRGISIVTPADFLTHIERLTSPIQ